MGGRVIAPEIRPPVGYAFSRWDRALDNITESVVITAIYEECSWTVTFDLRGGTRTGGGELVQTVGNYGRAILPTVQPPTEATLTGFDEGWYVVVRNTTCGAKYSWQENLIDSNTSSNTTATLSITQAWAQCIHIDSPIYITRIKVKVTNPVAGLSALRVFINSVSGTVGSTAVPIPRFWSEMPTWVPAGGSPQIISIPVYSNAPVSGDIAILFSTWVDGSHLLIHMSDANPHPGNCAHNTDTECQVWVSDSGKDLAFWVYGSKGINLKGEIK
ncbi:MAG: hypothetical protein WCI01_07490 [Chlorobiaceae bacterium]